MCLTLPVKFRRCWVIEMYPCRELSIASSKADMRDELGFVATHTQATLLAQFLELMFFHQRKLAFTYKVPMGQLRPCEDCAVEEWERMTVLFMNARMC